ncbi:MAG TPA: putative quinol monooxygenase [Acidimicrobiales bacterium]|nr:putative quinol monooxygenase [Acidimicrobiales bacterium]
MVIVSGVFEVDPSERDEYLAGRVDAMTRSRAEDGCLEYVFAGDPVDTGRVVLYERWASQAALDAHLAGMREWPRPEGTQVRPKSAAIYRYDASNETKLG